MKLDLLDLGDVQKEAEHASTRERFETTYDKCIDDINKHLRVLQNNQSSNLRPDSRVSVESSAPNITIKQNENFLPELPIPTFNGNSLKWHSFQYTVKSFLDLEEIKMNTPANLRSLSENAQMHENALEALNDSQVPKFDSSIEHINKHARGDDSETDTQTYEKPSNQSSFENMHYEKQLT